jgi:hypothetical protein
MNAETTKSNFKITERLPWLKLTETRGTKRVNDNVCVVRRPRYHEHC